MNQQDNNAIETNSDPVECAAEQKTAADRYARYPVLSATPYKRKDQDEIFAHVSSRQAFATVLFSWVFGILFSAILLRGGFGVSVPLLVVIFYAIAAWYLTKKDPKPDKRSYLLMIPIALLSLGYVFQDNIATYLISFLMLIALIGLQLSRMSHTSSGQVFSPQSLYQTMVSTIARPFGFLDAPFKAVAKNVKRSKKGSKSATVLFGLIIALPIAAIFTALFVSADDAFGYFVRLLFSKIDIFNKNTIFDLFFGTAAALFISSWLITLRARKAPEKTGLKIKFGLNQLLTATVLSVINLVQIAFVVVQFGYLFAGMKLPDGMTRAEYARSGFFELCVALCFSVSIIIFCLIFVCKDEKQRLPKAISLLLTVFIACNFVIIASAFFRMISYIAAFDLSVKRVMVTWLITVFAICMIGAAIKIWVPKFRILRHIAITAIVMTVALNFVNINSQVANYNVNRYIDSMNTKDVRVIDVSYLSSLGPSAAKATLRLY